MQPRIKMSEPTHRTPLSPWQRERMGGVKAMNAGYAATSWRQGLAACLIVLAVVMIGVSL